MKQEYEDFLKGEGFEYEDDDSDSHQTYDDLIPKDDFNRLWEINPQYSKEEHDYENTRRLVTNVCNLPGYTTNDGKDVTLKLITERYKRHVTVKNTINEGTEPKYIKKENKVLPIFEYVFKQMYNSIEKLPETHRHFYFWELYTGEDIKRHFAKFKKLCQKTTKK